VVANTNYDGMSGRSLVIVDEGKDRTAPRVSHVQRNDTVTVPTQQIFRVGVKATCRETVSVSGIPHESSCIFIRVFHSHLNVEG
jgi:hypothetical protein